MRKIMTVVLLSILAIESVFSKTSDNSFNVRKYKKIIRELRKEQEQNRRIVLTLNRGYHLMRQDIQCRVFIENLQSF